MASTTSNNSFTPRYDSPVVDQQGILTRVWLTFVRKIAEALEYVGDEYVYTILNNKLVAETIRNLTFDYQYTSQATIEYLIQRVTSSTELIETGIFQVVYRPDADTWVIVPIGTAGPDVSGVTFSITSDGNVQYTSTNIAGTEQISRIVFRVREIAAKSSIYSKVG